MFPKVTKGFYRKNFLREIRRRMASPSKSGIATKELLDITEDSDVVVLHLASFASDLFSKQNWQDMFLISKCPES